MTIQNKGKSVTKKDKKFYNWLGMELMIHFPNLFQKQDKDAVKK